MAWGKGREKFECNQDPNTKELVCELARENKDGTKVPLASLRAQSDGMCNVNFSNVQEFEEGALDKLKKKVESNIVARCQKSMASGKPEGY